jgi:hypothetical protein
MFRGGRHGCRIKDLHVDLERRVHDECAGNLAQFSAQRLDRK